MRKIGGIVLLAFGVLSWISMIVLRGDYIATVVYPDEVLGEAIWAYDPGFFIVISLFCWTIVFIGLYFVISTVHCKLDKSGHQSFVLPGNGTGNDSVWSTFRVGRPSSLYC